MIIRKKNIEDFNSILQLVQRRVDVDGLTAAFYWPQEILHSELYMTDGFVGCVEKQGELIVAGFVLFRNYGFEYEVSCLASLPSVEGQGVMTALLSHFLATKPQDVKVFLEVHVENTRAQSLYEKLGFVKIAERINYYKDRGTAYVYLAQ